MQLVCSVASLLLLTTYQAAPPWCRLRQGTPASSMHYASSFSSIILWIGAPLMASWMAWKPFVYTDQINVTVPTPLAFHTKVDQTCCTASLDTSNSHVGRSSFSLPSTRLAYTPLTASKNLRPLLPKIFLHTLTFSKRTAHDQPALLEIAPTTQTQILLILMLVVGEKKQLGIGVETSLV